MQTPRMRLELDDSFSDFQEDDWDTDSDWHYIRAYQAFQKMYRRITTGNPLDPWRMVEGDRTCSQKSSKRTARIFQRKQKKEANARELKPIYYDANIDEINVGFNPCFAAVEYFPPPGTLLDETDTSASAYNFPSWPISYLRLSSYLYIILDQWLFSLQLFSLQKVITFSRESN